MDSTTDALRKWVARNATLTGALLVGLVAIVVAATRGGSSAVLWMAFGTLGVAVMLFWEALRLSLDTTATGDEGDEDEEARTTAALAARKRAALRALKEIAFERSVGRISEEDFEELGAKYRAEAKAAMEAMDEGLGSFKSRAEAMLAKAEREAKGEVEKEEAAAVKTEAPVVTETKGACPKCQTQNDADAVFCKKCATRLVPEETADA